MIGKRFGKLTIKAPIGKRHGRSVYTVECDCGSKYPLPLSAARRNKLGCPRCANADQKLKHNRKLWQYGKLKVQS